LAKGTRRKELSRKPDQQRKPKGTAKVAPLKAGPKAKKQIMGFPFEQANHNRGQKLYLTNRRKVGPVNAKKKIRIT